MKICARYNAQAQALADAAPVLLLEGSWPSHTSRCWSLDEAIDARFGWIDCQAADWAEQIAGASQAAPSFAWLVAVRLRYALVKLLRVVAFFDRVWPLVAGSTIDAYLEFPRDAAYAELLGACARAAGCRLVVHRNEREARAGHPKASLLRRALGAGYSWKQKWAAPPEGEIFLCGNARILDPVCSELLARGHRPNWLFEEFAARNWWRWRSKGVGQLCLRRRANRTLLPARRLPELSHSGVSLVPAIACWLADEQELHGSTCATMLAGVDEIFRTRRPACVVLDQDGTPLARALIAAARRHGARSIVVQHGVPYIRFGFAPLVADVLCAWGQTSQQQFVAWGIDQRQIRVTGFPEHDDLAAKLRSLPSGRGGNFERALLLATPPARDERPDAVRYHLTRQSHAELLRSIPSVLAAAGVRELTVKLHPRDADPRFTRDALRGTDTFAMRFVSSGSIADCLENADLVLSLASTAGIEATLAGRPVIQLMPPRSSDLIDDRAWGLVGTARDGIELSALIEEARSWQPSDDMVTSVFGPTQGAARRVADVVVEQAELARVGGEPSRSRSPTGSGAGGARR